MDTLMMWKAPSILPRSFSIVAVLAIVAFLQTAEAEVVFFNYLPLVFLIFLVVFLANF